MVDWRLPYRSTWRVYRVARDTWADSDEVLGVTEASVERSCDGDAPLLERGSMSVDMDPQDEFAEGYCRIVMIADQDGERERVEVATLLLSSTEDDIDYGVSDVSLVGRSVLWPASKSYMSPGSYAPNGADGAEWAARILAPAINAPVIWDGGFTLDQHYVFGDSTTVLSAVWTVLKAGNHTMQIAGDGTVSILPMPTEPDLDLGWANARLLHTEIHRERDMSEIPNRYFAIDGNQSASAINDDPTSPTSTVSRGWFSDVLDRNPKRVNGETLDNYCARMLEESSTVWDTRQYEREWWPGVTTDSIVRGTLASVGMEGDMRVVSQGITCGVGLTVEETVRAEVRTWQRPE